MAACGVQLRSSFYGSVMIANNIINSPVNVSYQKYRFINLTEGDEGIADTVANFLCKGGIFSFDCFLFLGLYFFSRLLVSGMRLP